jgi:HYR domain/Secretion system C-terminal sorting domain
MTKAQRSKYLFVLIALSLFITNAALAQTTWIGPASGGLWSDAANWNTGLPAAGNNAQIFGTPVIFVNRPINVAGFSIVNYGTLEVTAAMTVTATGSVENAGTINFTTANGKLLNSGSFKNYSVALWGAGTTFTNELASGFENYGTVTLETLLTNKGNLINSGTLNALQGTVQSEGVIDNRQVLNTKTLQVRPGASLTNQFGAKIDITGTGATFLVEGPVLNQGDINNAGTADIKANFNNIGTFTNLATGLMTIYAGSLFDNAGGPSTLTNAGKVVNNGTFNNGNTVNNTGVFENNSILNNNNVMNNKPGSSFTNKALGLLDMGFGSSFVNQGFTSNIGDWKTLGAVHVAANATFENPGTFLVRSGGTFTNDGNVANPGTFSSDFTVANNNRWSNSGTVFVKSGSILTNRDSFINLPGGKVIVDFEYVNDANSVLINQGQLTVNVRSFLSGNVQNDGLIQVFGETTIRTGGVLLNRELLLLTSGGLLIEGTLTNQKTTLIDDCSYSRVTGSVVNSGLLRNAGIINRQGTITGAVTNAGGYIHTVASANAPTLCKQNAEYPADGTGLVKVYAQSLITFATFDSCSNYIYTGNGLARPLFACSDIGSIKNVDVIMKLRFNDSLTCTATVKPVDKLAANFTGCPGDQRILTEAETATATWTPPTAIDNCTAVTVTASKVPGATFPVGITGVSYIVTDGYGNTNECQFRVDVVKIPPSANACPASDLTAPTLTNCPVNLTVSTTGTVAPATWATPMATDLCAPVLLTSTNRVGDFYPVGVTTVTYTAKDKNNNTSNCSFTVTVQKTDLCATDVIPPFIVNCPGDLFLTRNPQSNSAVGLWVTPFSADNCEVATFTATHAPGAVFPAGTTTVLYTAKDTKNNTSTCSFTVLVSDTDPCPNDVTAPVINGCPASRTVQTQGTSAPTTWTAPTATDACAPVRITGTHTSGVAFPLGITTVLYVATDNKGNTSSCTFNVIVASPCSPDATAPVITGCPANQSVNTLDPTGITITWTTPTVTDGCGGVSLTSSFLPGAKFVPGLTTVVYNAADGAGNTATCTFNISVSACNNVTSAGTVSADQSVCLNGDPVAFTATAASGGGTGAISYQWQQTSTVSGGLPTNFVDVGGATAATFDAPALTVTTYYRRGAIRAGCTNFLYSNAVKITIINTPPTITCKNANLTLPSNGGPVFVQTTDVVVSSAAGCGTVSGVTLTPNSFATAGTFAVIAKVTNSNGLSAECTSQVVVNPAPCIAPPTVTCKNATFQLPTSGGVTITAADVVASSTPGCGTITTSLSQTTFSIEGTYTVTVTVTNSNNATANCNATVTVSNAPCTTPPTVTCKPAAKQLPAGGGTVTITATDVVASSTAGCGTLTTTLSQTSFTAAGTFPVSVTVRNSNNVTATCTAQVAITGSGDPCAAITITPGTTSITVTGLSSPVTQVQIFNSAYTTVFNCAGNCPGATTTASNLTAGIHHVKVNLYTANWVPICEKLLTVTVGGTPCTTPPTVVCKPATKALPAGGSVSIVAADVVASSTPGCGTLTTTLSQSTFTAAGTYPVTVTVTNSNAISTACSAQVTITGAPCTTPPTVTCKPVTKALPAGGGSVSITATDVISASTAGCGTITNTTLSPTSFTAVGTYSVTVTVTNSNGTTASCSAQITITAAPTGDACANLNISTGTSNITIGNISAGIVQIQVFNSLWSTIFNCPGTCTQPTQIIPNLAPGSYYVKVNLYTANWTPICEKLVSVTVGSAPCNIAPTVNCKTANFTLPAGGTVAVTASDVIASMIPGCGSITNTVISPATISSAGTHPVTVTVTNSAGLTNYCTTNVTVSGTACSTPPTVTCKPVTKQLPAGGGSLLVTTTDVVQSTTPGCGTTLSTTLSLSTFTNPGTYPVTVTVTNANGATASCTAQVTITAAPVGSNCDAVAASTSANAITITGLTAPITQVQVYNSAWNTVFNCAGNCTAGTQVINNLAAGLHNIKVNLYSATWQPICEKTFALQVGAGPCNTPPTITCKPATLTMANGSATLNAADITATATANCGTISSLTVSQSTFTTVGTYNVTLTGTNSAGQSANCVAAVTVISNTGGGTCTNNLLLNPGFESGIANWWTYGSAVSGTIAPQAGTRAFELCGTTDAGGGQSTFAIPGRTYTMSVQTRLSGAPSYGYVAMKFMNSGSTTIGQELTKYFTNTAYATQTLSGIAPVGTAYVQVWAWKGGGGCMYADSWCLTASGAAATIADQALVFNAEKLGNAAQIRWVGKSAQTQPEYTIERSDDGLNFQAIHSMTSAAQPQERTSFTYLDKSPNAAVQHYRVRMTEADGTERFSEVIKLDFSLDLPLLVFPNPASGLVSLQTEAWPNTEVTVQLVNPLGVVVRHLQMVNYPGQSLQIDLDGLSSGLYMIWVSGENGRRLNGKVLVESQD